MIFLVLTVAIFFPVQTVAVGNTLTIYQDADISNHRESAEAIQQWVQLAFDEIGSEIQGFKIAYRFLDHRGNVVPSRQTINPGRTANGSHW